VSDSAAQAAGTYTFAVNGAQPRIDSGEVLIVAQGGGFLRRVLRVVPNGSVLTVETGDASLEDLGITGSFESTIPVSLSAGLPQQSDSGPEDRSARPKLVAGAPQKLVLQNVPLLELPGVKLTATQLEF